MNLTSDTKFSCFLVEKDDAGNIRRDVTEALDRGSAAGRCGRAVAYSSLNYKDALASEGHPGVVRKLPHVPGIDAAGTIVETSDARFRAGQEVIITGYELGALAGAAGRS